MKSFYTMLVMAGVSTFAYAQTMDSPLILEGGAASYTWSDDNTDNVYWKYTNTEGHSVLFSTPSYSLSFQDTEGNDLSTVRSSTGTSCAVADQGSILLVGRYYSNTTTLSFTYTTSAINFDANATAEAPTTLTLGDNYYINASNGHLQYTATEDGVLLLTSSSYMSTSNYTVDGTTTSIQWNYNNSKSVQEAKVPVEAGKTYLFELSGYSALTLTAELTHPVQGAAYDYPFELKTGENTLPAAYGEYWYAFTPTESGNLVISGTDAALAGSTISFYNSASNAYYNSATATSTSGNFALRTEVTAGTTYYIKVTKTDATAADQAFNMEVAAYEAGDKADNPIVLTSGEAQTLKSTTGTYYYAIDIPSSNGDMILDIAASGLSSYSSNVLIYNQATGSYYNTTSLPGGSGTASAQITATAGARYIIVVTSYNEATAIQFTATLKEIAEGDLYTKPIAAVADDLNILPGTGTKYYSYTATKTGKLIVTPTDLVNTTITFPQGNSSWSGNYTTTLNNGAYEIDATAGTTYIIKIVTSAENVGFLLSERDYVQGESDSNPLPMEGGVYTLGGDPVNVWVSYTAEKSGILVIGGDMEADNSHTKYVEYKKQGGYATTAYDGTNITASVPVEAGDVYLIHIVSPDIQEGKTVTVTVNEYSAGQSVDLAIEMKADEATVLPAPSRALPTWTKVKVQSGTLTITREETGSAYGYIYKSYEEAKSGSYNSSFSLRNYEYDASYNYITYDHYQTTQTLTVDGDTATYYYIKYESADATPFTLTYSGTALAAEETPIEPEVPEEPEYNGDQTKIEEAKPLTIGENSYTWAEGSTDYIYWKYTNSSDESVLLSVGQNTSFVDATGASISSLYGSTGPVYPLVAGETVYMKSSAPYSGLTLTFTASVEAINYAATTSADAPLAFTTDKKNVFIMSSSYGTPTAYMTYTATEDAVLELVANNYISSASYTTGETTGNVAFSYKSGSYVAKLPVVAGNTYVVAISASNSFILTGELTHPVIGASYDYAIPAVLGENTVAAPFSEAYWYEFTPETSGNLVITSDETLPGGSVTVYNGASNVNYGYSAGTSEAGTFNTRCEVIAGETYYIKIVKAETTAAAQTFNLAVEAFEAGDRVENPIVLTSGEAQTLKSATGTYYYSIQVPAAEDMILNVTAEGVESASTYLTIYNQAWGAYSGSTYSGTNAAAITMNASKGVTYILAWTASETAPIQFTATLKSIAAGDSYDKPIVAEEGVNLFPDEGDKYYTYTATLTGKLSILPTDVENTTVTFPQGSSTWSGSYTTTINNGASEIDVVAGQTYVIKFSGTGVNTAAGFTLSEREYAQGDTDSNPLVLEGDTYTFGNETVNAWYAYTVKTSGVLTLSGTMECDNDNYVEYKKQGGYASRAYDGTNLTATFPVEEGEVYLFHIVSPNVQPGNTVEISIRDYEAGETLSKAITLQPDSATTLPNPTRILPTWTKATVKSGTLTLTAEENGSVSGYIYKSYEDAQAGTNGTSFYMTNYDYTTYQSLDHYVYTTTLSVDGDTAAVYYIEFTSSYATNLIITLSGDAVQETVENSDVTTGINGILSSEEGVIRVFDLSGRQVNADSFKTQAGTYIIRENGRTRKVVIK